LGAALRVLAQREQPAVMARLVVTAPWVLVQIFFATPWAAVVAEAAELLERQVVLAQV
jgi:hypothetical protein